MTYHRLTPGRAARRLTTALLGGLIGVTSVAAPARADVGDVTEYPVAADSFPAGITRGPDGALWFADMGAARIGRITTDGTVTNFDLPDPESPPFDIARGSDGALWFTEYFRGKIGRITTEGQITEYEVPTTDGAPLGIAPGPDGALWFTEQIGNKIGRITTDGTVTEYPIPTEFVFPYNIAPGPRGTLWFTEQNSGNVGRITTSGAITEFPVPRGDHSLGITSGPGGMWFTLRNSVARITNRGRITEFPVPYSGSELEGITRGPNGHLWFADKSGRIGQVTASGAFDVFPVPDGADKVPFDITTGPDRRVWFTEPFGHAIGRAQALPNRAAEPTPGQRAATPTSHTTLGGHAHRAAPPVLCERRAHGPQLPDRVREVLCGDRR